MEIVFLLISLAITLPFVYGLGRLFYTYEQLLDEYKRDTAFLAIHLFLGMMTVLTLFILQCGLNNSLWHLPYLTQ